MEDVLVNWSTIQSEEPDYERQRQKRNWRKHSAFVDLEDKEDRKKGLTGIGAMFDWGKNNERP